MMLLTTITMVIAAYLIGSISSAILLCRLFNLPDPRTNGSKNPGATNVLRMGNKILAVLVLVFDVLKGTIPVWSAYFLGIETNYLGFVAIAACLGHMFPVFFQFKGGKAVATALGVMLPIGWSLALLLIGTWGLVVKFTKYSSLAAIITVLLAPFYTWLIKPAYVLPVMMISVLIIFRHKDNITRLLAGKENKIGDKS